VTTVPGPLAGPDRGVVAGYSPVGGNPDPQIPTGEEVAFDVADGAFDTALFIGRKRIAGPGLAAVVTGEVEVTGIEDRRQSALVLEHGDLAVVHDEFVGDATEEMEGVAVGGQGTLPEWNIRHCNPLP